MIVDELSQTLDAGAYQISARLRPLRGDDEPFRLWFRFPARYAPEGKPDASVFVPPALVRSLRRGEDLIVEGPVSPRLLDGLPATMRAYRSFFSGRIRKPIAVEADRVAPGPGRELTATMFTRGVDSSYAALEARDDPALLPGLTHAVYAPAWNAASWSDALRDRKTEATRRAAADIGLELIELESNITDHFGRGLLAAALALGFTNVLIPSGRAFSELVPKGTHPQLDPRLSTERTEIHHYGDASRLQKVERISQVPAVGNWLRVCRLEGLEDDRNCCRCEKCLRTMLELHVCGALVDCPAFDRPLTVEAVATMADLKGAIQSPRYDEILHALGDSDFDRRLADVLRVVMLRADVRLAARYAQRMARQAPKLSRLRRSSRELEAVDKQLAKLVASLSDGSDGAETTRAKNAAGWRGAVSAQLRRITGRS